MEIPQRGIVNAQLLRLFGNHVQDILKGGVVVVPLDRNIGHIEVHLKIMNQRF